VCLLPCSEVDLVGVGGHRGSAVVLGQTSMWSGDAKKTVSEVIEELEAM
jgi:hypothetical protein